MIENRIRLVPIEEIVVKRDERKRTNLDMGFVGRLAKQIKEHQLINPITIDSEGVLIAGENRLAAFFYNKELMIPCPWPDYKDWSVIPTRTGKNITQADKDIIEMSENLGRSEMIWQDKAKGLLAIFRHFKEQDENTTYTSLANNLNLSPAFIAQMIGLAENLDDPQISGADNWKTAVNILTRKKERAISSIMDDIEISPLASAKPQRGEEGYREEQDPLPLSFPEEENQREALQKEPPVEEKPLAFQGLCKSFMSFAPNYTGPKFNLIHFDPPYGINLHKSNTMQKSGRAQYEDTRDLFHEITECFFQNQDKICSSSAHMLFWHSAPDREMVGDMLRDNGWKVWKYPLVWHKSCNTGLFPDPQRGPRHTYEMATLASRGDRKIVKLVADSFSGAATKASGHESEKPVAMLEHFFTMLVDQSTSIFDPTGGSGNALLAAQNKGAKRGLFLELEQYYPETFNKKQRKEQSDES